MVLALTGQDAAVGALTGLCLGLVQRDPHRTAWLVLAGAVGFAFLYLPDLSDIVYLLNPINSLLPFPSGSLQHQGLVSALQGVTAGILSGGFGGACLGVGNAIRPRSNLLGNGLTGLLSILLLTGCQALPSPAPLTSDQTPTSAPAATMVVANWLPYSSSKFSVSLRYPPNWQLDTSGNAVYSGPDGFFQITAVESLGPSAKAICELFVQNIQTNPDKPGILEYGRQPALQILQIDHQPACLLWPSDDQATSYRGQALLLVEYPDSVRPRAILQFWADKNHMSALVATLSFVR
jgi:TolB protein